MVPGAPLRSLALAPTRRVGLAAAAVLALAVTAAVALAPLLRALPHRPPADATAPAGKAPVALPWAGRATGQVREFMLTVSPVQWELAPGTVVAAYAYNGRVPGPELRVTEGDTVRVSVINHLPEPTTIHWHGVELPVEMDGVPQLSQEPIPPGGTFAYEFVAYPAGTRWYHSHFNEVVQQGGGLVGALIIEPREQAAPALTSPPDREYALVLGEWAAETPPRAPLPSPALGPPSGMAGGMMGRMTSAGSGRPIFDTFTVNGKRWPHVPPLVVRQGERVRLRLINAGTSQTQVLGLAGHRLTLTHSDGNPLAKPLPVDTVFLGVGERADVEFLAEHPGKWLLRGLGPGQAERGLAVHVVYEGHEHDPEQDFPPEAQLRPMRYADLAGPPPAARSDRTYDLVLSAAMVGMAGDVDVWTINGKSYPKTSPIEVWSGQRVRLRLTNMSMLDHPMHLHGHTFQVVMANGRAVNGPLKDTLTVRHMERYEIEFVANNPGTWLFHCHNLHHMAGGLVTEVRYR
jgi:FtsP/CotA-like multicopper oxidase with cupredoxin domain